MSRQRRERGPALDDAVPVAMLAEITDANGESMCPPRWIIRRIDDGALLLVKLHMGVDERSEIVSEPVRHDGAAELATGILAGAEHRGAPAALVQLAVAYLGGLCQKQQRETAAKLAAKPVRVGVAA